MSILEEIQVGHNNAVTRGELCIRLNLSDRLVRKLIEEARKEAVIVNLSDGRGYFIPDPKDEVDNTYLAHYILQEQGRINSIKTSIQLAKRLYESL